MAFVLLFIIGYEQWGLYGTGIAITLAHLFEYLLVNGYAYKKYGYRCSATVFRYAAVHLVLGLLVFLVTLSTEGIAYWLLGTLLVVSSCLFSLQILRQKTHLWQALTRRLRKG